VDALPTSPLTLDFSTDFEIPDFNNSDYLEHLG